MKTSNAGYIGSKGKGGTLYSSGHELPGKCFLAMPLWSSLAASNYQFMERIVCLTCRRCSERDERGCFFTSFPHVVGL